MRVNSSIPYPKGNDPYKIIFKLKDNTVFSRLFDEARVTEYDVSLLR